MPDSICFVDEETCSNPHVARTIGDVVAERHTRRSAIKRLAAASLGTALSTHGTTSEAASVDSGLTFRELERGLDAGTRVADGYQVQVVARWGDPIAPGVGPLDVRQQSAARQSKQFGYNCDFIAFLPLPSGSQTADRGLLCVNHEYTNTNLMFPGLKSREDLEALPREVVEAEMAAMGHTVVEVRRDTNGVWQLVADSEYNRRITALDTPMRVSGPAAGHERLRTSADPSGRAVIGTLNNCAGGITPWGTMLICEENFNNYFSGSSEDTTEHRNHQRYDVDGPSRFNPAWAKHFSRFDLEQEPNEPNRFGWVVEFDPYDPGSVPVKRTALGRVKHEGAGIVVNADGRVVVYCGDDERFDYVYRFVTRRAFDPGRPDDNRNLLNEGTLSVARFEPNGTIRWLPLVFGQGPLTPDNDFHSQADVLIETRRAADLLGATPMDRPEDVEPSPVTGRVYVVLSNNSKRTADQTDPANPRAANLHGHILELTPPRRSGDLDHAADEFSWNVFLRGGDPRDDQHQADCHSDVSEHGWVSCPDNVTFDDAGRLWLTTDGAGETTGTAEGVYVCETDGPDRARTKCFFQGPRGSEVSGVCVSPDGTTLFVSVQHPGEEEGSDFESPSTRWPDFDPNMPPRPAVVAISRGMTSPLGT